MKINKSNKTYVNQTNSLSIKIKQLWNQPPESLRLATLGLALFGSICAIRTLRNEGILNDTIFVPIFEEILYRGIFSKMADVSLNVLLGKPKTAIAEEARTTVRTEIIAGIFGITHEFGALPKYWLTGRSLGYLKESKNSYVYPIAVHMGHNICSEIEQYMIDNKIFVLPFGVALDTIILWKLGKNINPLNSIMDAYNYCFKQKQENNAQGQTKIASKLRAI